MFFTDHNFQINQNKVYHFINHIHHKEIEINQDEEWGNVFISIRVEYNGLNIKIIFLFRLSFVSIRYVVYFYIHVS